ncbi:MAG: ABC transporter ATP-binding protein/permease [Defluviitaleaceae bacterium]|nr:ABC transporter ATP-binding protein/permease [Defluviitaleaceae bacterium]
MRKKLEELSGFWATVTWCLSLSWKSSKFYTIIRIAADIITPLLAIVAAFVGKHLLDLLSGDLMVEDARMVLLLLFLGLLGIALLRRTSQIAVQYSQSMQSEMLNGQITLDMMARSLNADLEYFDNPAYYDRLTSATQDSMAVSYILWNVLSCISASVAFIGAFAVLIQANPIYGIVMMMAAIPASVAAAKYAKLLYNLSLEQVNEHRQMHYCQHIATEKIFAQDMRLFSAGERLRNRYRRIWAELFSKRRGMTRKRSVLTGILECLPEIVVVLIGVDIAFGVLGNTNTVGDYALFTGLAGQLWSSINMFSSSALQIYDNKLKIENIKRLDTFKNRVEDTGNKLLSQVNSIVLKNITFTYPGSKITALDNISFTLCKDEKVVLVGLNGSGKSTLIKLLLRMYEPDSGAIYINGVNIREYKLSELRANFSVYFQEMNNYNFTLRENFTIADAENPDADVNAELALNAAYARDIWEKASKGLDTSITRLFDTEGIELSGGQHQKIALARALYRKHTALILDEPSSNLDPKAENEIFKNLENLTDGKLTIFTSHRLSNVALADRIIVLEKGRVVEDGTQEELLRNKHLYAELFQYQQEKYLA